MPETFTRNQVLYHAALKHALKQEFDFAGDTIAGRAKQRENPFAKLKLAVSSTVAAGVFTGTGGLAVIPLLASGAASTGVGAAAITALAAPAAAGAVASGGQQLSDKLHQRYEDKKLGHTSQPSFFSELVLNDSNVEMFTHNLARMAAIAWDYTLNELIEENDRETIVDFACIGAMRVVNFFHGDPVSLTMKTLFYGLMLGRSGRYTDTVLNHRLKVKRTHALKGHHRYTCEGAYARAGIAIDQEHFYINKGYRNKLNDGKNASKLAHHPWQVKLIVRNKFGSSDANRRTQFVDPTTKHYQHPKYGYIKIFSEWGIDPTSYDAFTGESELLEHKPSPYYSNWVNKLRTPSRRKNAAPEAAVIKPIESRHNLSNSEMAERIEVLEQHLIEIENRLDTLAQDVDRRGRKRARAPIGKRVHSNSRSHPRR